MTKSTKTNGLKQMLGIQVNPQKVVKWLFAKNHGDTEKEGAGEKKEKYIRTDAHSSIFCTTVEVVQCAEKCGKTESKEICI